MISFIIAQYELSQYELRSILIPQKFAKTIFAIYWFTDCHWSTVLTQQIGGHSSGCLSRSSWKHVLRTQWSWVRSDQQNVLNSKRDSDGMLIRWSNDLLISCRLHFQSIASTGEHPLESIWSHWNLFMNQIRWQTDDSLERQVLRSIQWDGDLLSVTQWVILLRFVTGV